MEVHSTPPKSDKKIIAGILAILLGALGVHKFFLGYTRAGIIHLIISIVTCGTVGQVIGLIEGIVYLTKSDEEFEEIYVRNQKEWF
ncbi:MAG TPA: TM2 domain-containing protein [Moheibacter sp.]|nr:TM2 domain-containing protein [Moheibacter sp.]